MMLKSVREKEGRAIYSLIQQRLDAIEIEMEKIRVHIPVALRLQREKICPG